MSDLNLNDKLSKNHYLPPSLPAPIMLVSEPQHAALKQLVYACPAGLYRINEQGDVRFEPHGCLECGTCRILCGNNVIAHWHYPQAGSGVIFRFG